MGAELPQRTFDAPYAIHSAMQRAELAWRRELAARTIADVRDEVDGYAPAARQATQRAYDRS